MGSQISLTLLFVFCLLVQQLRRKRPGHSAIPPRTAMSHSTTTHPRCTRVQGFSFQRGKRGGGQRAGARGDPGSGQNTEMIGMDWIIDNPRSQKCSLCHVRESLARVSRIFFFICACAWQERPSFFHLLLSYYIWVFSYGFTSSLFAFISIIRTLIFFFFFS